MWKDLKHQLHSSTATGRLHILNFLLRLLQACLQGLNTSKKVKPPGLLRPECLQHALLLPRRTSATLLSSDADWLIFSLLFPGSAYICCRGPRRSQLPPSSGRLGNHVFMIISRSKITWYEEKPQLSWNCNRLTCVALPNKKHFWFPTGNFLETVAFWKVYWTASPVSKSQLLL